MKNQYQIWLAAVLLCTLASCGESWSPQHALEKPNVILIMTDDQGYGELSFHGNPILKTPQLDRLAGQSVRLHDFHVAPMCTPTRGQLMTGLDAARNGAINVSSGRTLLRADLLTMADFFTYNEYRTGLFGKWHLGDNYPYRPEDRGFQETLWFPSSHISSLPDYWGNNYNDDIYVRNGRRESFSGYCTDVFFENAIAWMSACARNDEPFFVYLPTNAPHGPLIAPPEDIQAIEAAFAEADSTGMKPALKNRLVPYLAMIRNIDTNMGRLMDFIEKEELADNTILIFMTDNGSTFGSQYYNAGMRGNKTQLWEGGHRVPCFFRWPNGGFGEPRIIEGVTHVQDILPTLIDLCNLNRPMQSEFDGISLAPALRGEMAVPDDRMLVINYSRMPIGFDGPSPDSPSIMRREGAGVLWKRWRYLRENELYDLSSDPMQQANVIDSFPEVAEKMRNHLYDWWEQVKDIANEPQRVVIGSNEENPMMLTACDWLDVFVDQQMQVLRGVRKNGFWKLQVDRPGDYEFELRRWPREIDIALMDAPSDGTALPIAGARFLVDGDTQAQEVPQGARSAVFNTQLEAGPVTLQTFFEDGNGQPICGAFYVYVQRK